MKSGFAWNVYRRLASGKGNVLFSPFGLRQAVGRVAVGAANDTRVEMLRALELGDPPENDLMAIAGSAEGRANEGGILRMFNAMLKRQEQGNILPSFLETMKALRTTTEEANFSSEEGRTAVTTAINVAVATATLEKVPSLLTPNDVSEMTALIILNAFYFKAPWMSRFDITKTTEADFRTPTGNVQAPMMQQEGQFAHAYLRSGQLICLPYNGGFNMYIALPYPDATLESLISEIATSGDNHVSSLILTDPMLVVMPRFKIAQKPTDMVEALRIAGIRLATSMEADLSGISGDKSLYLAKVIQASTLETTEEGSEGGSGTTAHVEAKGPRPSFVVNRPATLWVDDIVTGETLYLGRLSDPTT